MNMSHSSSITLVFSLRHHTYINAPFASMCGVLYRSLLSLCVRHLWLGVFLGFTRNSISANLLSCDWSSRRDNVKGLVVNTSTSSYELAFSSVPALKNWPTAQVEGSEIRTRQYTDVNVQQTERIRPYFKGLVVNTSTSSYELAFSSVPALKNWPTD